MAEQTEPRYQVTVNDEDQYSIWPDRRELPAGWHAVGEPAGKDECLRRIDEIWTDMRPRSVRTAMEQQT